MTWLLCAVASPFTRRASGKRPSAFANRFWLQSQFIRRWRLTPKELSNYLYTSLMSRQQW